MNALIVQRRARHRDRRCRGPASSASERGHGKDQIASFTQSGRRSAKASAECFGGYAFPVASGYRDRGHVRHGGTSFFPGAATNVSTSANACPAQVCALRPDLAQLVAQGPAALVARVLALEDELAVVRRQRVPLGDSRTTHAPPSSDPRPKPRSERRKSLRRTGGQPGHPGHRLAPDEVVRHPVSHCRGCGLDLSQQLADALIKHQVFDLPKTPLVVTEHQMECKCCPQCAAVTRAPPPPGVEQPTQYGPRLAAFAIFLYTVHFVPFHRVTDVIAQLTGRRCQWRLDHHLSHPPLGEAQRVSDRGDQALARGAGHLLR